MPLPPLSPVQTDTPPRVNVARYVRNGLIPHASFESSLGAATDFVASIRVKELLSWDTPLSAINEGKSGTTILCRFAGRTSKYHSRIVATLYMAAQDNGSTSASPNATVVITNISESTTYATKTVSFGAAATGTVAGDVPSEFAVFTTILTGVPADTAIYGRVEVADTGRLVAVCINEESLPVNETNGYLAPSAVASGGPIYADRRETLYEMGVDVWNAQAAHLFNWAVDQTTPRTNATSTFKNIGDNAASGATGPVWRLDTTYCRTRARSTVPCVFAMRTKMSTTTATGQVRLVGVNGGTISTTNLSGTTTERWIAVSVNLPAALDDYYVEFAVSSGTGTLTVLAASLYQYDS